MVCAGADVNRYTAGISSCAKWPGEQPCTAGLQEFGHTSSATTQAPTSFCEKWEAMLEPDAITYSASKATLYNVAGGSSCEIHLCHSAGIKSCVQVLLGPWAGSQLQCGDRVVREPRQWQQALLPQGSDESV